MNTRTTAAALCAAALLALTACSSDSGDDKAADTTPTTAKPTSPAPAPSTSSTPSTDQSSAAQAAGIPPEPIGAVRVRLLRALAAANPDIVRYEDKAVDAARNQCGAINGGAQRLDRSASQRFTYKDVTTTETQGKQINQALEDLGFCEV
ncbi:hypothetical protein ADK57_43710 [Streptomyces sp. MMG1533]|uniref:hypothetical protein n=1 Tax=Streptomyces sp. MMG1533 TaxID=1415546 RepID=UPI0006ADFBF1|nr:hypothetical protein [Streptomyces sp. MMG1533]KOU55698.1 hypothetical protein ADK57_43710 [Streptomyces sp. MMG1533]